MNKSINTYKELLTVIDEKNPKQIIVSKTLFDWLYHFTDSEKIDDNKLTIRGSSVFCIKEV